MSIETPNTIQLKVIGDVIRERKRQDAKWGQQNHNPFEYLAILGEEVGEANQAAVDAYDWDKRSHNGQDRSKYREEMVQVAAVAIAAIECLDRGLWVENPNNVKGIVNRNLRGHVTEMQNTLANLGVRVKEAEKALMEFSIEQNRVLPSLDDLNELGGELGKAAGHLLSDKIIENLSMPITEVNVIGADSASRMIKIGSETSFTYYDHVFLIDDVKKEVEGMNVPKVKQLCNFILDYADEIKRLQGELSKLKGQSK